jgi:hypothetical protein
VAALSANADPAAVLLVVRMFAVLVRSSVWVVCSIRVVFRVVVVGCGVLLRVVRIQCVSLLRVVVVCVVR